MHDRSDGYKFRIARGAAWGLVLGGALWLLIGALIWAFT